jgi:TRAP-type mannitol/chloroaromatic compound transport system permease small subunit
VNATIGILGQAILMLVALALVVIIVFFVLVVVRAIVRIIRDIRLHRPALPPTDAYIPRGFDRLRQN